MDVFRRWWRDTDGVGAAGVIISGGEAKIGRIFGQDRLVKFKVTRLVGVSDIKNPRRAKLNPRIGSGEAVNGDLILANEG